jgi:hypothetical protein
LFASLINLSLFRNFSSTCSPFGSTGPNFSSTYLPPHSAFCISLRTPPYFTKLALVFAIGISFALLNRSCDSAIRLFLESLSFFSQQRRRELLNTSMKFMLIDGMRKRLTT